jgi:DNA-binding NarL/FixJ family response regulator
MLGSRSPRWQCQDLSRRLDGLASIKALDLYGVAYIVLTEDASRAHLSATAAVLLTGRHRDHFWQHLCSALASLGVQANAGLPRSLPSWGSIALQHSLTRADGGALRVVTFQPLSIAARDLQNSALTFPNTLPLSAREQQIARLIAEGESTKRIAAMLGISCHTARHHTEKIFSKLAVRSRAAVAAIVSAAQ